MLHDDANILRVKNVAAIDAFSREYIGLYKNIDWHRVCARYDGILIAPYLSARRLNLPWYYPWDCASACVWNSSMCLVPEPR